MNLGGLDLNLLVALDALLSERSVTRAAQRVGLSQPGMSNALGRLRRLFDDPLLVRQGATLVPTARARGADRPGAGGARAHPLARSTLRPRFDPATDRRSVPPELLGLQRADAHRPARARAGGRGARASSSRSCRGSPMPRGLCSTATSTSSSSRRRSWATSTSSRCACGTTAGTCCVWEGNTRVGKRMTLERYTALGHLIYSMGGAGQPVALPDLHLGAPRRPAPHRGERRELPARALPAAGHRPRHADPQAGRGVPSPHGRHPSARVADRASRRSSRRSGGTRARPPTRPTRGCARGSARSREGWRAESGSGGRQRPSVLCEIRSQLRSL